MTIEITSSAIFFPKI